MNPIYNRNPLRPIAIGLLSKVWSKRMKIHKIIVYYGNGRVSHGDMRVSLQWLIQNFSKVNDNVDPLPEPQTTPEQTTILLYGYKITV